MSGEATLYKDFALAHMAPYVKESDLIWAEVVGGRDSFSNAGTGPVTINVPIGVFFNEALAAHVVGHLDLIFACRPRGAGDADQIVRDLMNLCAEPGHPDWTTAFRRYELVAEAIREAVLPGSGSIYSRGFLYAGPLDPTPVEVGTPSPFKKPFPVDAVRAYVATMDRPGVPAPVPPPPPAPEPEPEPTPEPTMRICYDSTNARDIPVDAPIVAGYIDGAYRWSDADWARFPNAVKVRIAVFAWTDDGQVGDVEPGCMSVDESVGWVLMRRAAAVDPTLYVGISWWGLVRQAFHDAGVPEPHYWIAHYDGDPTPIPGAIAKQYANPTFTGYHYDASIVVGRWPGIEEEDDMFSAEDRRKLNRVYDHLEAYEPMTWIHRLQLWLAKAIASLWPAADLSGPDVASGDPFVAAAAPVPGPVVPPAPTAIDLSGQTPRGVQYPTGYSAASVWHRLGQQPPLTRTLDEVAYTVEIPGDPNGNRETFVFSPNSPVARKV